MRFLLFLVFISFYSLQSFAQIGKVYGYCYSSNKVPIYLLDVHYDTIHVKTDKKGYFEIDVPLSQDVEIQFKKDSIVYLTKKVILSNQIELNLGKIKIPIRLIKGVTIQKEYEDPTLQTIKNLDLQKLPVNSVERTLVYTTAASSNNELTSNYNVRGGSYDENLVYINGFLVNRPFITRAGQQEGMSIIYSSLVNDLKFSGGGFDARYGDKLSSVLDINYITPDSLNGSLSMSLLGIESHIASKINSKLDFIGGIRYRSNGYFLNALPTKGSYNPIFYDGQFLTNYSISSKLTWSNFLHLSSNQYRFAPQSQETDFGTVNEAYRLNVYFDGQEHTSFQTMTGGTSLSYKPTSKLTLDLFSSVFKSNESESYDVLSEYFINQLETDPSKKNVGDSVKAIGIGGYLNHARNQLNATLVNIYHNGTYRINDKNKLFWGMYYQRDIIQDQVNEWKYLDSAGYSQIYQSNSNPKTLNLNYTLKSNLNLTNERFNGYLQHSFQWGKKRDTTIIRILKNNQRILDTLYTPAYRRYSLQTGVRLGYTEVNHDFYVTPRVSFVIYPRFYYYHNNKIERRNAQFRFATGLYYQPPIYREFRTLSGELNLNVLAQKSFHIITGYEHLFSMWNRSKPFKLIIESYYKYLWDVNPYSIDNVRTRYLANNDAIAYATGLDVNVHGEFVEGVQSFFKMGFLSTKENLLHDKYVSYYNKSGEQIVPGYTSDNVVTDSVITYPGFIPRPTDQWMNFAILFQDKMPKYEMISAQLGLQFGSRLPYGPPGTERYKDTLRQKSYFRVDLGASYDFLHQKKLSKIPTKLSDASISFEVYNLMGINNILSHQWIQDVSGRFYSIPNYLTQRRFNLKLILRF
jgi:hypothetical protein